MRNNRFTHRALPIGRRTPTAWQITAALVYIGSAIIVALDLFVWRTY